MRFVMFLLAAILATSIGYSAIFLMRQTHHGAAEQCVNCHLNDPRKEAGSREALFKTDTVRICADCHPDSLALSHPVNRSGGRDRLPQRFPLDWRGKLTCVTCHFFHDDKYGNFLRTNKVGKEFCLECHEAEFFARMKDAGEALKTAHLSSALGRAELAGVIDDISLACIDCHDGNISIESILNVRNANGVAYTSPSSSHPIGMNYEEVTSRDRSYKLLSELPKEIVFPNGQVGCVSCHAPYKNEHGALVISSSGSGLCLACHKI